MSSRKARRKPFSATLQITEGCNLACKMCYFWGDTGTYSNPNNKSKPIIMEVPFIKVKDAHEFIWEQIGKRPSSIQKI